MDALVTRITALSYDLFGIFFPGFLAIIISSALSVYALLLEDLVNVHILRLVYYGATKEFLPLTLLALATGSYLIGWLLKYQTQKQIPVKSRIDILSQWLRLDGTGTEVLRLVLFCGSKQPPANYKASLAGAYQKAVERLRKKLHLTAVALPSTDWGVFYLFAKTYIANNHKFSLLTTYQNKYTFHRSVAAYFAVQFWITLALMLLVLFIDLTSGKPWLIHFLSFLIFTLFSLKFSYVYFRSFERFWKLWGDTVIIESSVQMQ